jgi:hypothetical protein
MPAEPFRYPDLQGRLRSQGLRQVFTRGRGGQLAFLLVLGVGILAVPLSAPLLAAGYAAACVALMIPTVRQGMADPSAQREIITAAIGERFAAADIATPGRRAAIDASVGVLAEIAVRIHEVERDGRVADRARSAFSDASGLVDLQLESARQAESLERVLAIVTRNDPGVGTSSTRGAGGDPDLAAVSNDRQLRQQNIDAVRAEAVAADELIETIGHRLETILLQTSQIDRETIDLVRADEAVRESGEAVQRLQDVVESRRRAASRLISVLSTDDEPYASRRS